MTKPDIDRKHSSDMAVVDIQTVRSRLMYPNCFTNQVGGES